MKIRQTDPAKKENEENMSNWHSKDKLADLFGIEQVQ